MQQISNPYIARVTWSDNGWQKPSGPKTGHEDEDNFTVQNGFGYEEWLFSNQFTFQGFSYGFVQGMYKTRPENRGQSFDVYLYTISRHKGWFFVGRIKDCQVLTDAEATEAYLALERHGLIDRMKADVAAIMGNTQRIDEAKSVPRSIFPIRFKPQDLEIFDHLVEIPVGGNIRGRYVHYQLNEVSPEDVVMAKSRAAESSDYTATRNAAQLGALIIDLEHRRMQDELAEILGRKYKDLKKEFNHIDLFIPGKPATLIEIKTYDTARASIREALGQILEYAHLTAAYRDCRLVIIGPAKQTKNEMDYVSKLNQLYGLNLYYAHYEPGSYQFEFTFD